MMGWNGNEVDVWVTYLGHTRHRSIPACMNTSFYPQRRYRRKFRQHHNQDYNMLVEKTIVYCYRKKTKKIVPCLTQKF